MKKFLALIMVVCITCSLVACGNSPANTDLVSIATVTPASTEAPELVPTLSDAIKQYKEDPYATVNGYELDNYGWLSKKGEGSIGNIHTFELYNYENIKLFKATRFAAYSRDNGVLYLYEFGELVNTFEFGDAVYCGLSEGNGFIFRNGDEVFRVGLDLDEKETIATGVKMVITCQYEYNSDAWSQPLLLMEDDSLKIYVQWEEELMDIYYEGGYGGTPLN